MRLSRQGLELRFEEARLAVDWTALPRRRFELSRLEIPSLEIDAAPVPRAPARDSNWSVAARVVRIGRVDGRWNGGGAPMPWTADGLELSYADDRVELRGGRWHAAGSTAAITGWALTRGEAADIALSLSGPFNGPLRAVRTASGWTVSGRVAWEGLPVEGRARLAPGGAWSAALASSDAGRRAPPWARAWAPLRARLEAQGRGWGDAGSGDAVLRVSAARGAAAEARAAWRDGRASASWEARIPELPLAESAAALTGVSASGRLARAGGRWSGEAAARVRSLVTARGEAARALRLFARGTEDAHELLAAAEVLGATLTARGQGRWAGGEWLGRWSGAAVPGWSAGPFETRLAAGGWALEGLAVSDGRARGEAAASSRDGALRVKLSVAGLELGELPAGVSVPAGLAGSARAAIELAGPPRALRGRASWEVARMSVAGIGPGLLRGEGAVEGGVIRIEDCRWEHGGAWASLAGSAPLPAGLELPDFELRLETGGWENGLLEVESGPVIARGAALEGRLLLRRARGALSAEGVAAAKADFVRIPSLGFSVSAASAVVSAEGDSFRVAGAALGEGGAPMRLEGGVGLEGPALRFSGEKVALVPRPGTYAEGAAELELAGRWSAPRLSGRAVLSRAELGPPARPSPPRRWISRLFRRRAPEPPAPRPPAFPPRLSLDLRVDADRNVWYKDGATSVELKGSLRLHREPPAAPRLFGQVETLRGRVGYYGRSFDLLAARLDFAGDWPPDPHLEASAVFIEDRSRTRVNLALSGRLSAPRAELASEPPLEQRDILSVLAIGRPIEDADAPGGREDNAARDAAERLLAAYASQSVRQHLLGGLNLDVFQFRLDHERRSHLTVGRYISRDLFLTVDQSFGVGAQRSVKAEYSFSPSWSLELLRTGLGHSVMDLYFRRGFY